MDDKEEEKNFIQQLQKFWDSRGQTIKIPQIGGRELEVYKLYKAVTKRGGLKVVSANKLWKVKLLISIQEIVDQFQFPATCTSASFTLRNHYQKLLLAYEQKYFFGKEDGYYVEDDLSSNRKKPRVGYDDEQNPPSYVYSLFLFPASNLKTNSISKNSVASPSPTSSTNSTPSRTSSSPSSSSKKQKCRPRPAKSSA